MSFLDFATLFVPYLEDGCLIGASRIKHKFSRCQDGLISVFRDGQKHMGELSFPIDKFPQGFTELGKGGRQTFIREWSSIPHGSGLSFQKRDVVFEPRGLGSPFEPSFVCRYGNALMGHDYLISISPYFYRTIGIFAGNAVIIVVMRYEAR